MRDGYPAYLVETSSGDSFTGIQLRETADTLYLRDATHDEIAIPKNTIKKRRAVGTLMPTGLADGLTDGELAGLVRFLSELGKPGGYDIGHAQVERRWLVLQNVPGITETAERGKLLADPHLTWVRQFTNVAGELPFHEIPGKRKTAVVLRGTLDVTAPGAIALDLNGYDGVELWADNVAIPVSGRVSLDLPVGKHTLEFWLDANGRKSKSLRCEVVYSRGSRGRAQWAN